MAPSSSSRQLSAPATQSANQRFLNRSQSRNSPAVKRSRLTNNRARVCRASLKKSRQERKHHHANEPHRDRRFSRVETRDPVPSFGYEGRQRPTRRVAPFQGCGQSGCHPDELAQPYFL